MVSRATAREAISHLIELGDEARPLFEEARRAQERYYKVAGIGHRRIHNGLANIDYVRGRYHGVARALAALGGLTLEEDDVLEFIQELSDHLALSAELAA